ncbi:MAG: carbohydrate kinase [Spirochaetaceae bacterium]|jgi:sugar (pentulose or hexulose) kinase|nr:carbohydrate kinase [Spirochaetaceae bacterium]
MEYAIAVIDIGMTNKKVAVYDDALKQVDARYRGFPPKMAGGLETHDLEGMEAWFIEMISEMARKYPIGAIAVTTHGATFVCVGKDGKPSVPCVYYTYEPGDDFHRRFYEKFGAPEDLQARTGTPSFKAMINPAQGIFFALERFPREFKRTVSLLQYPQYWGYRFTGKTGVEGTYIGCHGYLWDQVEGRLSSVARDLGVASLMPGELKNSWDILGTITGEFAAKTGLSRDVIVTMGIHDSNSSLLPHFAKKGETGFVLNSTGTWCVIMNPVKQYGFAPEELGKVVFFNISAFRRPVKTAIFLGGMEFETWSKTLMGLHNRTELPPYDRELYRTIVGERRAFLMPELTAGSGQFPRSRPRVVEDGGDYHFADIARETLLDAPSIPPAFRTYEGGIALLRISLVMQTLTALERAGLRPGAEVYTEGGFRKNEAYNAFLSAALPDNRVFLTDIAEASALGAAMTAKMALTGKSLGDLAKDFEVSYQEIPKEDIPELPDYRKAWLSYTEQKME